MIKRKTFLTALTAITACLTIIFGACSQTTYYSVNLTTIENNTEIHTALQAAYLADDDYTNITHYATANGSTELSQPEPISFGWTATPSTDTSVSVTEYQLEISLSQEFTECLAYNTTETMLEIYNLQIASTYYWRVTALLSDNTSVVSDVSSFTTTNAAPRNMYVDGVTNVRDVGGWKTQSDGRVTQGLLYRYGRLNESYSDEIIIEITEAGKQTMLEEMGIKSEVDLRCVDDNEIGGISQSPLGESVNYYSCPMEWNVSNILTATENSDSIKQIFSILSDLNNYPIIYHCNIGTDRTGLIAFLINGLLGVSEDDLYRDYLFSNFGKIGGTRTLSGIQNSYVATIKSYPGDTLSEKIYNCLITLGIPQGQLEAIRIIFSA